MSTTAPTPTNQLSETEINLMLAMRRNQDLIIAYKGMEPADSGLKQELQWAIESFIQRDERYMVRITDRMNDNLEPLKFEPA